MNNFVAKSGVHDIMSFIMQARIIHITFLAMKNNFMMKGIIILQIILWQKVKFMEKYHIFYEN